MAIESLPMRQPFRPVSKDKTLITDPASHRNRIMQALEAARDIAEEAVKKSGSPRRNIDIGSMKKGAKSVRSDWYDEYGSGRHEKQKWWPSDTTGKVENTHPTKRALTDRERQARKEYGENKYAPQKPESVPVPSQDAAAALAYRGEVGHKHTPEAVRRMIMEWNMRVQEIHPRKNPRDKRDDLAK